MLWWTTIMDTMIETMEMMMIEMMTKTMMATMIGTSLDYFFFISGLHYFLLSWEPRYVVSQLVWSDLCISPSFSSSSAYTFQGRIWGCSLHDHRVLHVRLGCLHRHLCANDEVSWEMASKLVDFIFEHFLRRFSTCISERGFCTVHNIAGYFCTQPLV